MVAALEFHGPRFTASAVGKFIGVSEQVPLVSAETRAHEDVLRGIGASLLVAPDAAQARLPYDFVFAE